MEQVKTNQYFSRSQPLDFFWNYFKQLFQQGFLWKKLQILKYCFILIIIYYLQYSKYILYMCNLHTNPTFQFETSTRNEGVIACKIQKYL